MKEQLRLPGLDPPRQVKPVAERTAPALWIRRLVVVRELSGGDEHVVRDVSLRRGLNIVWTPPHAQTGENALFQSGVAGHTAGKSTFCRLIRYALGERGLTTEGMRRRIRERFPQGWLLADIMVRDVAWGVARPFAIGAHPFCVEGGSFDQILQGGQRTEYQRFLDAVADITTAQLPSRKFPTSDEPVRWEHLLPWLSRDQECRFADFLEWRHSSSAADAPLLNVDERQFVVRSVLGLISDAERDEQLRNARLVLQKKEAARLAPLLAHQAATDRRRVQRLLGVDVASSTTELFASEAGAELHRQATQVDAQLAALSSSDPRGDLRTKLDRAIEAETNARRDLEEATSRLKSENGALELLTAAAAGTTSLLAGLPPPRDYCNIPMTLIRERGCPLATSRPIDLASRRSERTAEAELADQQKLVAALSATTDEKRRAVDVASKGTVDARRGVLSAATAFEERRDRLLAERNRLEQVERLVRDAEETWANSASQTAAVERIGAEIEASYATQDEIRRGGRAALGHFSSTFDYVVRAILGDEVEARIDTSGRSLALVIEHHGERESAALETVKLLAFDLAAMTESIQGRGGFPRFLLHDGPREADMAADIYERLFLFVRRLEECFECEAGFQYIVTSTTRPPEQFLGDPWRRLTLSGVPAEERLLRCDL
jgi:hypothetical protein